MTRGKSFDDFESDRLLRQAVERNFEITGEAIGRLRDHDLEVAQRIPEYLRIIAFRNTLMHGYDLIDDALVWDVIERKLSIMLREVETLLEEGSA